ncbi:MAG: hypothetical protein WCG05_03485 [Alphaproteobacteria bacterium]
MKLFRSLIFCLFLGLVTFCQAAQLLEPNQSPSPALIELLEQTNIAHPKTLKEIVTAIQDKKTGWIRTGERWDQQRSYSSPDQIAKTLKTLRLQDEVPSHKNAYSHFLVFGTNYFSIKNRLDYMIRLWNEGVRGHTIVFLGSTRPLNAEESEAIGILLFEKNLPITELGAMKYAFDRAKKPASLEMMPQIWVNTPPPPGKSRANTDDSINAWLEDREDVCEKIGIPAPVNQDSSILAISNAPYIERQGLLLKTILRPRDIKSETVGERDTDVITKDNISLYLDEIARILYQLQIYYAITNPINTTNLSRTA